MIEAVLSTCLGITAGGVITLVVAFIVLPLLTDDDTGDES